MDQVRPIVTLVPLALASAACAIFGPRYGSPDPLVMATIFVSSLTSSIAGFAFSAICGGILFHLWADHVQVVQILITCSIANQAAMVHALRRHLDWRNLSALLAGGALGLPLGVWALLHTDRTRYTQALGVFLLAYSFYMLLGGNHTLGRRHRSLDVLVGFIGGVTGGAAALPGAPVTIWCRLQGGDRVAQRARFQPFILVMQVAALLLIGLFRQRQAGFAFGDVLCVPAGLFGTLLGMAGFRRMSNRQFALAVNILLIVSGLSFVL